MLIYHQAFDSYHCFLRILSFLIKVEPKPYHLDQIRIIDFYLSAPAALITFKFPQELTAYRKIFSEKITQYNNITNHKSLFYDLKPIQNAVLNQMVSMDLINHTDYKNSKITLLINNIPTTLKDNISNSTSLDADTCDFLFNKIIKIPLLGTNGLKHRSGLMDHRYDLV